MVSPYICPVSTLNHAPIPISLKIILSLDITAISCFTVCGIRFSVSGLGLERPTAPPHLSRKSCFYHYTHLLLLSVSLPSPSIFDLCNPVGGSAFDPLPCECYSYCPSPLCFPPACVWLPPVGSRRNEWMLREAHFLSQVGHSSSIFLAALGVSELD